MNNAQDSHRTALGVNARQDGEPLGGDAGDALEQEDGRLEGTEEGHGTGEEEVADGPLTKGEALVGALCAVSSHCPYTQIEAHRTFSSSDSKWTRKARITSRRSGSTCEVLSRVKDPTYASANAPLAKDSNAPRRSLATRP